MPAPFARMLPAARHVARDRPRRSCRCVHSATAVHSAARYSAETSPSLSPRRNSVGAVTRCSRWRSLGLCIYGSHDSRASVSRLRAEIASCSSVRRDGIDPHAFRIVEQQPFQLALRQREDVGNVEPIEWTGLHADGAHQHQPAHGLRRLGGKFRCDPAADRTADHIDLIAVSAGRAVRDGCRRCRPPHRSSRAGWMCRSRDATARSAGGARDSGAT